jgi:Fe2+ or Zn2+ uptake regulation protein
MEASATHAALLRRAGLQVTAQRLAVLRAVDELPHSAAAEIEAHVRAHLGAVSLQAVYDALGALLDRGVVRKIQPAGSPARYELRTAEEHLHLICRSCGRVVDVGCRAGKAPRLEPGAAPGCEIEEAEIVYWGRCAACVGAAAQRSERSSRGRPPAPAGGAPGALPAARPPRAADGGSPAPRAPRATTNNPRE